MTPQARFHVVRAASALWVWRLALALLMLAELARHMPVQAAERTADIGPQVAAAYIHKFASFVEWPAGSFAQADSPVVIGVMGADAFADDMAVSLVGRTSNGRKLVVRKLLPGDPLTGLHMLFLGQLRKSELIESYARLRERPVLTITESEEAFSLGAMINFVVVDERLRFEVALKPVSLSNLKISGLMLAAARRVAKGTS